MVISREQSKICRAKSLSPGQRDESLSVIPTGSDEEQSMGGESGGGHMPSAWKWSAASAHEMQPGFW